MSVSAPNAPPVWGLALSGGGFRASFFHIGVLARLADLDLLRGVQRISTVSGGSIVGAHYYLKLKKCLEACHHAGRPVQAKDYVTIVQELFDEFFRGVQEDIRSRVFARYPTNETSVRLGEFYDRFFYGAHNVRMRDLRIDPACVQGATVPELFINATVLDTGQRWTFTPEGMGLGEQPSHSKFSQIVGEHRTYEYLGDYQDLPVGLAVAASSCVPLVFPPVRLQLRPFDPPAVEAQVSAAADAKNANLKVRANVRKQLQFDLVDGGVVDNLGLAPLTPALGLVLVSNASAPSRLAFSVNPRSTLAVGKASLGIQLLKTQEAANLQALARLSHAEQVKQVTLAGAKEDSTAWAETDEKKIAAIVELIRNTRTDLDVFSGWEAHALAYAGYVSAGRQWSNPPAARAGTWPFQEARTGLTLERARKYLGESQSPFKTVRLTSYVVPKNLRPLFVAALVAVCATVLAVLVFGAAGKGLAIFAMVILGAILGWAVVLFLLVPGLTMATSTISLALRRLVPGAQVPWARER